MARKTKEKLSICSFLLSSSFLPTLRFFFLLLYIFWVCQSKYLPLLYASWCVLLWEHCMCVCDAISCQASARVCIEVNLLQRRKQNKKKMKRNNKIANDKIKHTYLWKWKKKKKVKRTKKNMCTEELWYRLRWWRWRQPRRCRKKNWNLNKQMSKSRDSWHNYCTMHWVNNCPLSCIICSHAFYNCMYNFYAYVSLLTNCYLFTHFYFLFLFLQPATNKTTYIIN